MGLITINPNNGRQFADLKQTPIEELPKMLEDAKVAQKNWASKSFAQRSELLRAIALECEQNANDLGQLMHSEMGKPVEQAIGEVKAYCSGMGTSIKDMGLALKPAVDEFATGTTTVHYLPLGVAAIITPWNFPFGMPWTLLVPALLGGNAVLFKPSEICPQTALEMSKIFEKHLPKNTLQTIIGAKDHGVALVDQHVDLVAFVGSRNAGKAILKKASERATRVLLEMGGKDPMIVTPGANIEAAAKFAATASMRNTGQVCVSVERIYVHTDIAAEFVTALKANIEKISVGPENSSQADLLNLGPLSSETQMHHILKQVKAAVAAGATLEMGGNRLDRPGFWMQPTLLTGLSDQMEIMQEETFGPIACVQIVESMDEAIKFANNSRFGLGATLWADAGEESQKKALEIESGMVGLNRSFGGSEILLWAGAKESGYGHTGGISGMRSFLQPRTVTVAK